MDNKIHYLGFKITFSYERKFTYKNDKKKQGDAIIKLSFGDFLVSCTKLALQSIVEQQSSTKNQEVLF